MPKTLLLADDSVTIQKVVGISFANEDVRLLTVDNGDDAIARARETQPDAVLADVVMPGKNGYEVCEAIKSDPALRHIPVLPLTGTFEAFDAERARLAGADGFVTKPFEAQMLVDRVNELLARATKSTPAAATPPASPAASEEHTALDFLSDEPPRASVEREPETQAVEADELDFASGEDAFVFEAEDELATTARPGPDPGELDLPSGSSDPLAEVDVFEGPEPSATRVLGEEEFGELEASPAEEGVSPSAVFEFGEAELPSAPATRVAAPAPPADASQTTLLDDWSQEGVEVGALEGAEASQGPSELDLELAGALVHEDGVRAGGDPVASTREATRSTVSDAGAAREFDVSSSDLGDLLVAPPVPRAAPAATTAPPPVRPELPAELREELTAQLEKIAWEAFGDLTETLVRQTVARVETIAWEVIPQLAESLIREEIRKLKEGA